MMKPSSLGGPGGATDTYLYELTDHLGNVRAVISKTGLGTPVVVSRTDYYPFEGGALRKCPVDIFSERASLPRWECPTEA